MDRRDLKDPRVKTATRPLRGPRERREIQACQEPPDWTVCPEVLVRMDCPVCPVARETADCRAETEIPELADEMAKTDCRACREARESRESPESRAEREIQDCQVDLAKMDYQELLELEE